MAILRHKHESNFTVIPNGIFNDSRLNSRDIGILCFMLHLPDGWDFSIKGLAKVMPNDGKSAIEASLKRIANAGYLKRKRVFDDKGKIKDYIWILSDEPQPDFPDVENPELDNPSQINKGKIKIPKKNTTLLRASHLRTAKKRLAGLSEQSGSGDRKSRSLRKRNVQNGPITLNGSVQMDSAGSR